MGQTKKETSMRMLMIYAAVGLGTTAIVSSASAEGNIGCDPGLSSTAVQASSCDLWHTAAAMHAQRAFALAPNVRTQRRIVYYARPTNIGQDKTGVSGGND